MIPMDNQQDSSAAPQGNFRVVYLPQQQQQQQQHPQHPQQAHQQQAQLQLHHQQLQHQQLQHLTLQQQQQQQQQQYLQLQRHQPLPGQHPSQYPSANPYQVQVVYQYCPLPPGAQQQGGAYWAPTGNAFAARTQKPPSAPIAPHDNDVLMGRGGKAHNWVGNEKLRKMARACREEYISSSKKEKSALSRRLVKDVQALTPPGRFLKKNTFTSNWVVVDPEYAREKTSQCLRDAVNGGPSGGTDGQANDDNESDDKKGEDFARSSTPTPTAGEKRENSPVITPENSPKEMRRPKLKTGDLPLSLSVNSLEAPSQSDHNSGEKRAPRRDSVRRASFPLDNKQTSKANSLSLKRTEGSDSAAINLVSTLRSTEGSDNAVIDAWISMRDEALQLGGPPRGEAQKAPTSLSEKGVPSAYCSDVAQRSKDDCDLDFSGHSGLDFSGHSFALFEGDLLREEEGRAQKGRKRTSTAGSRQAVTELLEEEEDRAKAQKSGAQAANDTYMSRSDDPIDLEMADADPHDDVEYAPMATEDADLILSLQSDHTGQTEEMLAMLTDPFDTDFF